MPCFDAPTPSAPRDDPSLALAWPDCPRLVRLASADGRDLLEVRLDEAGLALRYTEDGIARIEGRLSVGRGQATRLVGDAVYGFSFADPVRHDEGEDPGGLVIKQLATVLERATRAFFSLPRLPEVFSDCARHLSAQVDQEAWAVARRFHQLTRRTVYRLLVADRSGRLAQLAHTAPGTLTLLAKLDEARLAAAAKLMQAVVDGWPLKKLTDEVVLRYLQGSGRCREVSPPIPLGRLLALRASPLVPASCILPRCTGYCTDDIPPRDDPRNPLWYRAMCALALTPSEHHEEVWLAQRVLTRHTSCHLDELRLLADQLEPGLDDEETMDQSPRGAAYMFYDDSTRLGRLLTRLLHYICASGRNPGRGTDPQRLVDRMLDWEAVGWDEDFFALAGPCGAGSLAGHAPPPPGLVVEELTTWERLRAESREMQHCVFSMVASEEGLDGRVVLHLTWQGSEQATALLVATGRSWCVVEMSGPRNAQVSSEMTTVVGEWVSGLVCAGARHSSESIF